MEKKIFYIAISFCVMILCCRCNTELTPTSPLFLISTQRNDFSTQATTTCVFRYKLVVPFTQLDNDTQLKAIAEGMTIWQKANKRINFLQFSVDDRCEILIKFADIQAIETSKLITEQGLVRYNMVGQSVAKKENGKYVIYLSNTFEWTKITLTKAICYHIGLMLGMATSKNTQSVMYPFVVNDKITLDRTDSTDVNRLYPQICKDADFRFLPFSVKLNSPSLFKIRLDKQGIIKIAATGQIKVGFWLGYCTPDGLEKGLFNFPISGYNVVPELNHAAIIYKKNDDANWKFCGSYCEIATDGSEYMELILNLNDKDLTDNSGAFDVNISYK